MTKFKIILLTILLFNCNDETVTNAQTPTSITKLSEPVTKSAEIAEVTYESREDLFNEKGFSEQELKSYIRMLKLDHPDIVYAQAMLETGSFKSRLFKNHNNLFGMTIANSRPTLAQKDTRTRYASYSSWQHSVIDYALYQASYMRNLSRDNYLRKLSTYAEDSEYIQKVKKYSKQYAKD